MNIKDKVSRWLNLNFGKFINISKDKGQSEVWMSGYNIGHSDGYIEGYAKGKEDAIVNLHTEYDDRTKPGGCCGK